jgi:segregation and condensation protein B
LLLSTAEPITLKDLVKIFARYHLELSQALEDAKDEKDEEAELMEVPSLVTQAQIRDMLTELTDEAEVQDKAYRVVEGPNGYQIVTAPQFAEFVRLLRGEPRPMKLSPAALETMSIIAYRQPVTRAEMEAIRGVSVDSALNKLIELELALVTGRAELPGRPIQYGTTEKFLEFTGIKELDELPASDVLTNHQIDDWMRRSDEEPEEISDEDVGLSKEPRPDELPLDEKFVEVDWQRENAESDAAPD